MLTAIGLENSPGIDRDFEMQAVDPGFRSPVQVLFTSMNRTLKALEKASKLANPLRTGIEIIAVQTVPYTLPLDESPAPFEFLIRRFEEMAAQFPAPIKISAYLCRDLLEALKRVLNRDCPIVMGVRKRWWPTRDERLAGKLRRAGYSVILVETE